MAKFQSKHGCYTSNIKPAIDRLTDGNKPAIATRLQDYNTHSHGLITTYDLSIHLSIYLSIYQCTFAVAMCTQDEPLGEATHRLTYVATVVLAFGK